MATFVLVHGGWMGGWVWGRVRNVLRDLGHNVLAPTLTGLGERVHLATPEVDLNTHVHDILGVLEYEDIHRVVLVGHGYGGMVISGVAEHAAKSVAHVVHLDAFVPRDGEAVADLVGAETLASFQEKARAQGEGWRVPFPFPLDSLGITSEVDVRWVSHRFTPQPLKTLTTPVRLSDAAAALPRTFIHCTRQPRPTLEKSVERARVAGWRCKELATGHMAPVTAPKELAKLLVEISP